MAEAKVPSAASVPEKKSIHIEYDNRSIDFEIPAAGLANWNDWNHWLKEALENLVDRGFGVRSSSTFKNMRTASVIKKLTSVEKQKIIEEMKTTSIHQVAKDNGVSPKVVESVMKEADPNWTPGKKGMDEKEIARIKQAILEKPMDKTAKEQAHDLGITDSQYYKIKRSMVLPDPR